MNLFICCTEDGTIESITTGDGPPLERVHMRSGERQVLVVDDVLTEDADTQAFLSRFEDLANNYTVDLAADPPRLKSKS